MIVPKLSSRSRYVIITLSLVIVVTAVWYLFSTDDKTVTISQYGKDFSYLLPYPERCNIHGDRLREDKVRIGYGLTLYDPNNKERFPYSNKWAPGGCLPQSSRYLIVMYCPKCRETEAETAQLSRGQR